MKYNDITEAVNSMREYEKKSYALNHAGGLVSLDSSVFGPKGAGEGRGITLGEISRIQYELVTCAETGGLIEHLGANITELDETAAREFELIKREREQYTRIPADEFVEYNVLLNDAEESWEKAKNNNDFAAFLPCLEKIIDFNRRFAGYYAPEKEPYNALLNEYERGLDMETLDAFFAKLREVIVPLLAKVGAAEEIDDSFLYRNYPADKQMKFAEYLMQVMGVDRKYCTLGETEHPFTGGFGSKDVRVTTHIYENALASSLYSVVHESGHALYELGVDPSYNYTELSGGVSMGIHESQSRFYENIIGRSREFTAFIFPKLKELFPFQLAGVNAEMFYRAVNKGQPSLIRTEADELTYCLHIMIRYELEKRLIGGTLDAKDVPAAWNAMYRDYLGIDVPDDAHGCLQDVHWSSGLIGYFPSYALGSAYGAQMLHCMSRDIDVWGQISRGDLSGVTAWLREKIHRFGSLKEPGALFESVCGSFDSSYFAEYLTDKYTALYNLK